MNSVFLDTNILLDVLEKREPHFRAAANIFEMGITGHMKLYASSLSFINCIYVGRKSLGYSEAVAKVKLMREFISVAPMTELELDLAFSEDSKDVEDRLQYFAALSAHCDCIVTRNAKHFPSTGLPVFSPVEFLNQQISVQ